VSAAVEVRVFLLGLLLLKVAGGIALAFGWQWWKQRQKRAKLQEILEQAQLYNLLDGRPQRTAPARRLGQGGNVILVGGQAPAQQPAQTWEVIEQ
jgi:hypothetical protein